MCLTVFTTVWTHTVISWTKLPVSPSLELQNPLVVAWKSSLQALHVKQKVLTSLYSKSRSYLATNAIKILIEECLTTVEKISLKSTPSYCVNSLVTNLALNQACLTPCILGFLLMPIHCQHSFGYMVSPPYPQFHFCTRNWFFLPL